MKTSRFTVTAALVLGASAMILAGCASSQTASSADGAWPAEVQENFISECKTSSGGQEAYCTCTMEFLQGKLTYEQLSEAETKMRAGESTEEFTALIMEAGTSCADKLTQ
ncbi:hypothetical protein [Schaalia suimastitidis]|uniref:hypothetical protein n=1 Tax=Schaalia suimastitidis TaxID=121163 RepID=UPI000478BB95|nr:hypothetical protein [Schaalia suimastitidis]